MRIYTHVVGMLRSLTVMINLLRFEELKMGTLFVLISLMCRLHEAFSQDITSSLVFDPVFYLNNHPDLEPAGIRKSIRLKIF